MATTKNSKSKSAAKASAKKAPAKKASGKTVPNGPVVKAMEKALAKNTAAKKAAKKTAAPAKAKPAKAKSGQTYAELAANRSPESTVESPVHAMWTLCGKMVDSPRKAVIEAAVKAGINYYTARTQYQLWLTAYRNS